MLSVRRINHPIRIHGLSIRTFQTLFGKSEVGSSCDEISTVWHVTPPVMSLKKRFYATLELNSPKSFPGRCMFSSQVRATDNGHEEDDLEDGFSELEDTVATLDSISEDENEDELVSEPEFSEEDGHDGVEEHSNELDLYDNVTRGVSPDKRDSLILLRLVTDSNSSVENLLDNWIEDGNELHKSDIYFLMVNLRKRRFHERALQLSEWLESRKKVDFVERDYASRLDLVSKVHGVQKAESYIRMIPECFRGEVVYRTLLSNCTMTANVKKAEEVFNKMKDLGFPVTAFACNQLLLLYKSDVNKIAEVLQIMEKGNVKPTLYTYHILIGAKGQLKDIAAIDQIFETMKAEGTEPDKKIIALMAKHYVLAGLKEKAKTIMKEIEGDNMKELRKSAELLLPLYAGLGSEEDVGRIWKACERNATLQDCLAAMEAWGKLNKVEEAESVFNGMQQRLKNKNKNPPLTLYTMLLKVYVDHKLLEKGKNMVKEMAESGLRMGPWTWDVLVNLYDVSGEVEKAESLLSKAAKQNQMKPYLKSFMIVMDEYANRGDVLNTEKMFYWMRQAGYVGCVGQFVTLIRAYRIAKVPAYGIRERIKGANIILSRRLAAQLIEVDAFRRNPLSDLLN